MGKLIYSMIMSLDGYVADEAGDFSWAEPGPAWPRRGCRCGCAYLEDPPTAEELAEALRRADSAPE